MRLFIAVTIPENSKKLLKNKYEIIKTNINQNLKWVNIKNWHLTLKFLGETEENKIKEIKNIIRKAGLNFNKFAVKFTELNAFPNLDHPRVLFFGINHGKNKIREVQQKMESDLHTIGFEKEKSKYIPHLTIARSMDNTNYSDLANKLKKFTGKYFVNIYMEVNEIKLIKSTLTKKGPIYEDIFSINLK